MKLSIQFETLSCFGLKTAGLEQFTPKMRKRGEEVKKMIRNEK